MDVTAADTFAAIKAFVLVAINMGAYKFKTLEPAKRK
jgi:hypothetical protein